MTDSDPSEGTGTIATDRATDVAAARHQPRRLPHISRTWAWFATVVGALAVGFALAQLLMPATVSTERVAAATAGASPTPSASVGAAVMPNVVGLDSATAQRVLTDAGIPSPITFATQAAAGPEGVVVTQAPASGQNATGTLTLTISKSATVPQVVGTNIADARTALEALGAVVQVTRQVDPTQSEGVVLAVAPNVGQPVPAVVTVTVSDPGDALTLASLDMTDESGCGTDSNVNVNGKVVQDSPYCSNRYPDSSYADWVLARQAVAFEATIGMADDADQGSAHLRIVGDDNVLLDTTVTYGKSSQVRLDVRGILRLHVEVTYADDDSNPRVVLADARLLGTADQLAAIEAAS